MASFHLNPLTGEAGVCRARAGNCPFGAPSDHYSDGDEARLAYEAIMEGSKPRPLSWLLSPVGLLRGPEESKSFVEALHSEAMAYRGLLTEEEYDAIHNYTLFGFERVNPHLRGMDYDHNIFESKEESLARTERQIELMDSAFQKAQPKDRVVYRYAKSFDGSHPKDFAKALKTQGRLKEPSYLSTSASIDWPLFEKVDNPKEPRVIFEIATRSGMAIQPKAYSQPGHIQSMENEVLLPRGMTFEVAGVELSKPLAFGGLKTALFSHANVGSLKDRYSIYEKEQHRAVVVKLVEVDS